MRNITPQILATSLTLWIVAAASADDFSTYPQLPTISPNPTIQPGTITPPPLPRIDDYSYTSIPGPVTRGILKKLRAEGKTATEADIIDSPRYAFGYGFVLRAAGRPDLPPRAPAGTERRGVFELGVPDLFFSTREGLDFGLTPHVIGNKGFAANARIDVSKIFRGGKSSNEPRTAYVRSLIEGNRNPFNSFTGERVKPSDPSFIALKIDDLNEVADAFNDLQTAPRVGLLLGYRDFEQGVYSVSYGLNYTRTYRLSKRSRSTDRPLAGTNDAVPGAGWQYSISAMGINVLGDNGLNRNTRRNSDINVDALDLSLRLTWLNQVPWVGEDAIYRNQWQVGVEFTADNALARDESFGIFVKRKFEPGTKGTKLSLTDPDEARKNYARMKKQSFEVSLGVGIGRDAEPYAMLRFSKTSAW